MQGVSEHIEHVAIFYHALSANSTIEHLYTNHTLSPIMITLYAVLDMVDGIVKV